MSNENSWYLKFYTCYRCGHKWTDEHDCLCDDRCPECDKSNGVSFYVDLVNEPDKVTKIDTDISEDIVTFENKWYDQVEE